MRFRLGLAIGFGVGYVLGTKAGHEQYERITSATQRLLESEPGQQIRQATSKVADAAGDLARGMTGEKAETSPVEEPAATSGVEGGGNGKV